VSRLIDELKSTEDHEIAMRTDILDQVVIGLTAHARAEESVVYQALVSNTELRDKLVHAQREHTEIDEAVAALDLLDPSDPNFLQAVKTLQERIDHHVREEENDLLPKAEREFGVDELARLIPTFNDQKRLLMAQLREERRATSTVEETEPDFRTGPTPGGMIDEVSSRW
jgi:hypothetical protein